MRPEIIIREKGQNSSPERQCGRVLFFRTRDGEVWETAADYRGPKDACLVIGISPTSTTVRIAYSHLGGSVQHAFLEAQAAPAGTGFLGVKARLRALPQSDKAKPAETILEIIQLNAQEIIQLEQSGHEDPNALLTQERLDLLQSALGAREIEWVKDSNGASSIARGYGDLRRNTAGIDHLISACRERVGD